jgi:hypothetical protein
MTIVDHQSFATQWVVGCVACRKLIVTLCKIKTLARLGARDNPRGSTQISTNWNVSISWRPLTGPTGASYWPVIGVQRLAPEGFSAGGDGEGFQPMAFCLWQRRNRVLVSVSAFYDDVNSLA